MQALNESVHFVEIAAQLGAVAAIAEATPRRRPHTATLSSFELLRDLDNLLVQRFQQ